MNKVQKIREVIEKRYEYWKEKESNSHSIESEIRMSECQHLLLMLDSMQEESVSEDLENAAEDYCKSTLVGSHYIKKNAFKAGMNKMKEQMMAKAIDATIGSFTNGTIYDADFDIDSNLKDNDKVKVIVIKED